MSAQKARFFVRIVRKNGTTIEPNVEFKTRFAAERFARELLAKNVGRYMDYSLYVM